MGLIEWDDSFSVNVELIDKQHQMLVSMINELYEAMSSGRESDVLKNLIKKLNEYAMMHFAREEHYFEIFAYPDTESHKKEHNDFEDRVLEFENDFNSGRQRLTIDVLNFLSNWLVAHIKGSDNKYGSFFNERGLK